MVALVFSQLWCTSRQGEQQYRRLAGLGCVPKVCSTPPSVRMLLPPCRYHQYKFIVDGKWRHDETAPFMPDPLGNVNNWLFVRRIDPTPR